MNRDLCFAGILATGEDDGGGADFLFLRNKDVTAF